MKGYIIDCKYIIRVKQLMEHVNLPAPRKRTRYLQGDGETLPIITIEAEI